jgi:hypothetical protein
VFGSGLMHAEASIKGCLRRVRVRIRARFLSRFELMARNSASETNQTYREVSGLLLPPAQSPQIPPPAVRGTFRTERGAFGPTGAGRGQARRGKALAPMPAMHERLSS